MNRCLSLHVSAVVTLASLSLGVLAAHAGKPAQTRMRADSRDMGAAVSPSDGIESDESASRQRKPAPLPDCPDNIRTTRLAFDFEGLDLDSGRIHDLVMDGARLDPEVDFSAAYDTHSRIHLRIQPHLNASLGVFAKSFDEVHCDDVMMISFGPDSEETPVRLDDTVVLFTPESGYFKVGNFVLQDGGVVEFDYVQLCVACEPEGVDLGTDPDAGPSTGEDE